MQIPLGFITATGAASSFESIATTTLGSAAASITFSGIAGTYKSLQLRGMVRADGAFARDVVAIQANGDTGSNYAWHRLQGDGASATATGFGSVTYLQFGNIPANTTTSNVFGTFVLDIIDYASTSKTKTLRQFVGHDANGSGYIQLDSGLWNSTSALTSIKIYPESSSNWLAGTTIALYGIKG